MKAKGQYNTNQRKELQSYLETIAGEHTTVAEICGHFSALGKSIGTSTVYRQLERMVDEHLLADHDFVFDNMRTVFYGICRNCRN